jgi:hypothetical protein
VTPCRGCGRGFEPRRPNQRYCCAPCRMQAFHRRRQDALREWAARARLFLRSARESLDAADAVLRVPPPDGPDDPAMAREEGEADREGS